MNRMALGWVAIVCGLTAHGDGVTITPDGPDWKVRGDAYEARLDAQGRLAGLTVGDQPFIAVTSAVPHGAYVLWEEPVPYAAARRVGERALEAQSARGRIQYVFSPVEIEMTVANSGTAVLYLFLPLGAGIRAVSGEDGKPLPVPVTQPARTSQWYGAAMKVGVTGGDRVWGPWNGAQVWEAAVATGEARRVVMTLGALSTNDAKVLETLGEPVVFTHAALAAAVNLQVASPCDYQVFQRYSRGEGRLFVRGRAAVACDGIEVLVTGAAADGKALPGDWRPLASSLPLPDFDGVLTAPAGGWYEVTVRVMQGGRVVAQAVVPHVGVGEVFVIAGQSNAANSGEELQKPASGRVSTFSGIEWRLADDPQPGVQDKSAGGSPWPIFGEALVGRYGVPVGIASTACGATRVRLWVPGSPLFKGLMARILQLGPNGFRAVLWHQGESDANQAPPNLSTAPDEYRALLTDIIRASRVNAGWEIPWFTAQATYHVPTDPGCPAIRAAQKALWDAGISLPGPDTDRLTGDHRERGGRFVHFSAKGLREHGRLWAESVGSYLDRVVE